MLIRTIRFPKRLHTRRETLWASATVTVYLAFAYAFTGWYLPHLLRIRPELNFYLVQPTVWGGLALLAYRSWRRLAGRPLFSRTLVVIALAVGVFSVSVLVIAGVVGGFDESPIARLVVNYPKNALFIVTLLVGVETARAFLYWAWRSIGETVAFLSTTILFFVVAVPATQWSIIDGADPFFRIVMGFWLPALALSALASWLVEYGGLGPSFAYRIVLVAFIWFTPILPSLDWPALLLVGTITPLVSAALIHGIYIATAEGGSERSGLADTSDS